MRHQRRRGKLGVKTHHRKALLRNLVRNLVIRKRIQTTLAKAKEASSFADTMVELAKRGDLHARRLLISRLGCADTAHALIAQIAPRFQDRRGGYTRVLRLGSRVGDAADMALLEFTAVFEMPVKSKKPKKEKKTQEVKGEKEKTRGKEDPKAEEKSSKGESTPGGKKTPETKEEKQEKKESEKKGGFLGALRRFLKGDEESH
ncbi:MAG TPA: 50S ribosomal protein L17 [bacterium]|nr:50S ribosomal protein L17 [bacterium]